MVKLFCMKFAMSLNKTPVNYQVKQKIQQTYTCLCWIYNHLLYMPSLSGHTQVWDMVLTVVLVL